MTEKNKMFRKIDKKFLKQKKYKYYELYEQEKFIKFLKHYKIYNFNDINKIEQIRKEREKQKEEIKDYIKQKEKLIKQKQQKPTKSQIFANKNEFSAYEIKLFEIVNEIFDGITTEKNLMFRPEILNELRLYLEDLTKFFNFKYYTDKNLVQISIRNLNKILEIKQILKEIEKN